jgi:AraC-like DNA-binding protein
MDDLILKNKEDMILGISINDEGKHIVDFSEDFPLRANAYSLFINSRLTQNYHDYLELLYFYKGTGTCMVDDKEFIAKEGDLIIFNNVELHNLIPDKRENLILIAIYFLPELLYKPGSNGMSLEYLKPFYCRGEKFNNLISSDEVNKHDLHILIKKIFYELINKKNYYKLTSTTLLQEALIELLYYYNNGNFQLDSDLAYNKKLADIDKLKATFVLIMNNYKHNITLEDAAKSAYMSPHYFCRFFKKVTGTTFKEYLLRIRIDKAKELLMKYNMSVTEIAYQVGFENLSYFFRVFKRFTSLNPLEFRKLSINMNNNTTVPES